MGDPVPVAPSLEPVLNAVLAPREDEAPNRRTLRISALAIVAAFLAAMAAQLLTRLIGLITNVAFYGRWSTSFVSPAGNSLGPAVVIVPIIGAILVGFIARYGSAAIRGHGIPEAMEQVLLNESRISARRGGAGGGGAGPDRGADAGLAASRISGPEAHERRLHARHRVERTIDLAATLAWVRPNER